MHVPGRMASASSFAAVLSAAFALGAQSDGPVIWYRSSEGCPDGEGFLSRLASRGQGARLAHVNDRIDFVVTLGALDGRSWGKLERQTVGSTVAIREIETQSCEEAADVLALTLLLTLNPTSRAEPEPSGNSTPLPDEAPAQQTSPRAGPGPSATGQLVTHSPQNPKTRRDASHSAVETPSPESVWLLGGQLGAVTGPTGAIGPKSALFVEQEPGLDALPDASARLGLFFARVEDRAPNVGVTTFGAHLDACPFDFAGPDLHVRPCLGFEFGSVRATGGSTSGRSDQGAWAAVLASGRASWVVTPRFALELEGGAFAPLIRYALESASGSDVYHSDPAGFFSAVGAALRVP